MRHKTMTHQVRASKGAATHVVAGAAPKVRVQAADGGDGPQEEHSGYDHQGQQQPVGVTKNAAAEEH
jgi:hypothetical protein